MTTKNLLFISIAFPPKLDSECIQTSKYFKYLARIKSDLAIDVLTSKRPTLFMPEDPGLKKYTRGYRQLIELKIYENKLLNYLLRLISPTLAQLPDSKFTFFWQWKKVVRKLEHQPDIIYSRSYPLSSTLMAYRLKMHFNIPWVIHLSDPWVDSPLHKYTPKAGVINSKWENKCFSEAKHICFTSRSTIKLYSDKYPELIHKFRLFPNVYDPEDTKGTKLQLSKKLKFVYTGGLAGTRSPEPLLKAILKLRGEDSEKLNLCEFVFSGEIDKKNKAIFMKYQDDSITHLGPLTYDKSTTLQQSAHLLMAIDSFITNNSPSVFFPSKLLDYTTAGRRIFAITTLNSTTDRFIKKYQLGETLRHSNIGAITNQIKEYLRHFENDDYEFFEFNKIINEHDAEFNAGRLVSLINESL